MTLARAATDTFTGIRPADVPAFIVAQLCGAAAATALFRWLLLPSGASESAVAEVRSAESTPANTRAETISSHPAGRA